MVYGESRKPSHVVDPQFFGNVRAVEVDRADAQKELVGDLLAGESAGNEGEDFRLARSELGNLTGDLFSLQLLEVLVDQYPRDRGADVNLAVGNLPDRLDHF